MAMSVNVGPNAVCHDHIDDHNLAMNLCLVLVFGNFDHRSSAHLIIHGAKIAFEGPSCTAFYIMSGLFVHSNLALALNESRYVMTFFTQGAIVRHRDQGFHTLSECTSTPTDLDGYKRFLSRRELLNYWDTRNSI